jgi:hypothetical protein
LTNKLATLNSFYEFLAGKSWLKSLS